MFNISVVETIGLPVIDGVCAAQTIALPCSLTDQYVAYKKKG